MKKKIEECVYQMLLERFGEPSDELFDTGIKYGMCRKCGKRVQLDAGGLIDFHKVPGERFNTCPGSKNEPEESDIT